MPVKSRHFLVKLWKVPATVLAIFLCTALFTLSMSSSIFAATSQLDFSWPEDPEVQSPNFILMDADTGSILYEKGSHDQCYPASITKLMTALLVLENCNLSDTITISSNAVKSVKYGDSTAALKEGEEFTVEQALYVMLIKSANDMAYALGEHVGGSIANFADMMNKRAAELGCLNTHFSNASGLTDVNHYTSAYDMALIAQAVIDNSVIMNALSYTATYQVPPTNKTTETRYYRLSHGLLSGRDYYYPYCIGGKTGYTDAAGHTLVSFAQKDGMRLICVILRSTDGQRCLDTTNLFEYAFNNFQKVNIADNEQFFSFNGTNGLDAFGIEGNALKVNSRLSISIPDQAALLIPQELDFNDLTRIVTYLPPSETVLETGDEGSNISWQTSEILIYYNYGNRVIGSTTLTLEGISMDSANVTVSTTLPYLVSSDNTDLDVDNLLSGNQYIAINIWLLTALLCIIVLIIVFTVLNNRKKHSLRFN